MAEFVEWATRPFRPLATLPVEFFGEFLADRNKVLRTATEVFNEADGEHQGRLIDSVLERAPDKISEGRLASVLETLTITLGKIERIRVAGIVKNIGKAVFDNIGKAILDNFTAYVKAIPLFRDAVFSNAINTDMLDLIWSNLPGLIRFFMDIVECTKTSPSNAEAAEVQDPAIRRHGDYNELDFSSRRNRHAAICQLQRFVLSVVYIWERLTDRTNTAEVSTFEMSEKTALETDVRDAERIVGEESVSGEAKEKYKNERWLFINGIAGEYHWTRRGCEKLSKQFGRKVEGVMNRGDGILWDLIECAGERTSSSATRTAESQRGFIRRTTSSRLAQSQLVAQLRKALAEENVTHVVIVAHSQGCLILRLALEELIAGTGGIGGSGPPENRLCVFTFGNPSVDWERITSPENERKLSKLVLRTEHFANNKDFVASLGVLGNSVKEDDYGIIFKNTTQSGHLFGAQYSLDEQAYENGTKSWLLGCKDKSMAEIQKKRPPPA